MATIALLGTAHAQGRPDLVAQSLAAGAAHVPGELLVQFKADASPAARARALARVDARVLARLKAAAQRRDGRGDLERVSVGSRLALAAALRALQADPAVDFAEPNWLYTTQDTSDDPYYTSGQLWGMQGAGTTPANPYGSGAATAWEAGKTCSSDVVVGVIDEGMHVRHKDLRDNVWANPGEIAGNGIDDDGNGYIDDVNGWDFFSNDASVFDGRSDDHGTHVSGTIAAKGGNAQGVAGVCWNLQLISAKFLGAGGGTTADAILAVDYMTDLKTRHGLNLVATNNSWGGGGFSQGLKDAIDRAGAADILFVAAAGNSGANMEITNFYPAGYDSENIISVANITSAGNLAGSSNYGATRVDLGAPGTGIWSTVPGRFKFQSKYASYTGTSMASPHVAGAVALYKSLNPGATGAQVKAAILAATIPTPSLAGKTVTGGRLDVSGF
ncbi:MAG: S8 family serine peptidase [Burkholderiaceae bacterium]|nr:S8 family serine peptidase [Burkholderiaceae bacterium]